MQLERNREEEVPNRLIELMHGKEKPERTQNTVVVDENTSEYFGFTIPFK